MVYTFKVKMTYKQFDIPSFYKIYRLEITSILFQIKHLFIV